MERKELLDKNLAILSEDIAKSNRGSEERKKAVESFVALYKAGNDEDKVTYDSFSTQKKIDNDYEIQVTDLELKRKKLEIDIAELELKTNQKPKPWWMPSGDTIGIMIGTSMISGGYYLAESKGVMLSKLTQELPKLSRLLRIF